MIPPGEDRPRFVDRRIEDKEPCRPQLRLISEHGGAPLRRHPKPGHQDSEDNEYLTDQQFGGGHDSAPEGRRCPVPAKSRQNMITGSVVRHGGPIRHPPSELIILPLDASRRLPIFLNLRGIVPPYARTWPSRATFAAPKTCPPFSSRDRRVCYHSALLVSLGRPNAT